MNLRVLGIETSCDETAVALYDGDQGLLGHLVHSQVDLHRDYGGVVPELASRDHIRKTLPLIQELLSQTGITMGAVNAIAYTAGPGLIGALLVGAAIGRSLAFARGIPAVAIHHMEGHLLAPLMEDTRPPFPFIALLVSGGHTLLVRVDGVGRYHILGDTLDDAAGEAFDKTAKLLGLDYPGGPALARLAMSGNPGRFRFPRPMTDRPGLDFSFSGLKTFALNTLEKAGTDPQTRADIAHAFQHAVAETFVIKCRRALEQTGIQHLVIAGGVSANQELRAALAKLMMRTGGQLYYPRLEFCTDNGAMIAYAGYLRAQAGYQESLQFAGRSRWPLTELKPA